MPMAAVLPGACRRTHRRFSAQVISRATCARGDSRYAALGRGAAASSLSKRPFLSWQSNLPWPSAKRVGPCNLSSVAAPHARWLDMASQPGSWGADALELICLSLSLSPPGTRPSRGAATVLPLPRSHFRPSQGARAWVDSLGASTCEPPGGIHLASSFACPCYLRPETQYEVVGCTFQ